MVAHLDAHGQPVRELWRVIGPVYLSVRFLTPSIRSLQSARSSGNGVVWRAWYLSRRMVPVAVAYLVTVWNGPAFSPITFALLMAEKALFEVNYVFKSQMASNAWLLVRSVLGIHIGADWPFFAGLFMAAYRRTSIYATFGMMLNMAGWLREPIGRAFNNLPMHRLPLVNL